MNSPITFAAAIKYCANSLQIDDLLVKVIDLAGRDGIGIAPFIGARTIEKTNLGEVEDEPVIIFRRDIGWFMSFICVFALILSLSYMVIKKCRGKEYEKVAKAINWKELEIEVPVNNLNSEKSSSLQNLENSM